MDPQTWWRLWSNRIYRGHAALFGVFLSFLAAGYISLLPLYVIIRLAPAFARDHYHNIVWVLIGIIGGFLAVKAAPKFYRVRKPFVLRMLATIGCILPLALLGGLIRGASHLPDWCIIAIISPWFILYIVIDWLANPYHKITDR